MPLTNSLCRNYAGTSLGHLWDIFWGKSWANPEKRYENVMPKMCRDIFGTSLFELGPPKKSCENVMPKLCQRCPWAKNVVPKICRLHAERLWRMQLCISKTEQLQVSSQGCPWDIFGAQKYDFQIETNVIPKISRGHLWEYMVARQNRHARISNALWSGQMVGLGIVPGTSPTTSNAWRHSAGGCSQLIVGDIVRCRKHC